MSLTATARLGAAWNFRAYPNQAGQVGGVQLLQRFGNFVIGVSLNEDSRMYPMPASAKTKRPPSGGESRSGDGEGQRSV